MKNLIFTFEGMRSLRAVYFGHLLKVIELLGAKSPIFAVQRTYIDFSQLSGSGNVLLEKITVTFSSEWAALQHDSKYLKNGFEGFCSW